MAQLSGRFINDLHINGGYPVVGDFVELKSVKDDFAIIEAIMPRKTIFYRKDMWNKTGMQILAKSSGAEAVIVLTKCDLCEEFDKIMSQCTEYFEGVKVIAISVVTDVGIVS